ncbi:uncharacterized protein LOC110979472 [Acanthaster planci]|uniref:Uncharacterized protein LOC110979472 n=1 Tax=Acanthaster planci TaxID=133434 RepID=A0A8B7YH63_ACAPL|nr:uncharacterized protein LOC110979472 [Acanthaster planci]
MVSFDVVSLFTNFPTKEACQIAKDPPDSDPSLADSSALSSAQIADLIRLCVSFSYFKFQDQFYDHLQEFLEYLNKQHPTVKFTMEQEQDGHLSFLDVHLSRNPDGTLNHRVHHMPTHTDRYLHQRSFHHPAVKTSVNHTLVNRAYEICDQNKLRQELYHIKSALKMNGYRNQRINLSKPSPRSLGSPIPEVPQTPTATVCLQYLGPTSHQLRSILQSANIKVHHSAPNKLQAALHTTRTSTHPVVAPVYIAFHLNAAKYTSGKLEGTSPPDSKNTTRTADEKNTSLPSSNMHTPGPARRVGQSRTHCSHPELAPKENPRSY